MGKCCVNASFVRTQFSNRSTQAIVWTSSGRIEGQKKRGTDRHTERETDRETEAGRETERKTDRQTELTAAAGDMGAGRSERVKETRWRGHCSTRFGFV